MVNNSFFKKSSSQFCYRWASQGIKTNMMIAVKEHIDSGTGKLSMDMENNDY